MVRVPRCHLWAVSAILIMLFFIGNGWTRADEVSYAVEGDLVRLYVGGSLMEEASGVVSTSSFTLARIIKDETALYYSLSDLVNESGDAFPRDMLVVKTPNDSDWRAFTSQYGRWSSFDDQICLLPAGASSAEIHVGLKGDADVWAGTYRGQLRSENGPDIDIEVVVPRSTIVRLNRDVIHAAVDRGPGRYEFELQVWIDANHADWFVTLHSEGLTYQGDEYKDVPSLQLYLPGVEIPLSKEGYIIRSSESGGRSLVLELKLETRVGWEHAAGRYEGTIVVNVRGNE